MRTDDLPAGQVVTQDPREAAGLGARGRSAVRGGGGELPVEPRLERPKRAGQGDYSTNAAMLLAPVLDAPPRVIAERIGARAGASCWARTSSGSRSPGPGFLNLLLSDGWHRRRAASGPRRRGAVRRRRRRAHPERILIEFVSANPTGPLVAASGRQAAYGDALARILEYHGHAVSREYYFNDAGNQIRLLGESVRARARGEEVPEGGYQGEYVAELAAQIPGAAEADPDELARAGR